MKLTYNFTIKYTIGLQKITRWPKQFKSLQNNNWRSNQELSLLFMQSTLLRVLLILLLTYHGSKSTMPIAQFPKLSLYHLEPKIQINTDVST